MKNISVITVVYNEEKRIESFLKSFAWSDDLIVVEKSSTDKTKELSEKYANKVITVPYSDTGGELKIAAENTKNDWILMVTASNIIHPNVVKEMLRLINDPEFKDEVISVPFAVYMFGKREKKSPWNTNNAPRLGKKEIMVFGNKVHTELSMNSKKIYMMNPSEKENLFHLTHETMDSFMERHTRYARAEVDKYTNEKEAFKICRREMIRSFLSVIKRRTILLGWDGLAISLAFISYFIMKYLYVWEKFRGEGPEKYLKMRKEIDELWKKEKENEMFSN